MKKTNKSKRVQNIFFCREFKRRINIRKAEENRYCYLNLKDGGRDIKYSSNGNELEDKIIEIFRRSGNKKKIPWDFVAKEVFSLKKKPKARHVNKVKNCWRKYTERSEPEKTTRSTNNVITPIEQQRRVESHENPNWNLHDNIDGRQIPSENISQGDCNLEEMMRDTSNRYESKDNVIPSFEQLSKEENGNNANVIFHDTLKLIPKFPDSLSQEDSSGEEVIQDTSKNVFQNTGLELDALNTLENSRINSDGLFQRNMPVYSLELILPKDWQKRITNYEKYGRFDQDFLNDLCKMLEAKNDFCCFKFRSNRCKKENSRKQNIPFWRGAVECSFEHCSCKANLQILKRNSNNICILFECKIKYSSLEVKRRKTTAENREHYSVFLKDNESSSKIHPLGLLKLSGDQFASGKLTGPSTSALNNINAQSLSHESAEELMVAIMRLRLGICNEDEALA